MHVKSLFKKVFLLLPLSLTLCYASSISDPLMGNHAQQSLTKINQHFIEFYENARNSELNQAAGDFQAIQKSNTKLN
jgi:hypothetical protein